MRCPLLVGLAVVAVSFFPHGLAGTADHRYKKGEHVELWVNKVRRGQTRSVYRFIVLVVGF